jgi:hypothetical protein
VVIPQKIDQPSHGCTDQTHAQEVECPVAQLSVPVRPKIRSNTNVATKKPIGIVTRIGCSG